MKSHCEGQDLDTIFILPERPGSNQSWITAITTEHLFTPALQFWLWEKALHSALGKKSTCSASHKRHLKKRYKHTKSYLTTSNSAEVAKGKDERRDFTRVVILPLWSPHTESSLITRKIPGWSQRTDNLQNTWPALLLLKTAEVIKSKESLSNCNSWEELRQTGKISVRRCPGGILEQKGATGKNEGNLNTVWA